MDFVIIIDSCTDLPLKFVEESKLGVINLTCQFQGKEYVDDFGQTLSYKDFYDAVRNGETPTTSQINVYKYSEEFRKYAKDGKGIIYLAFSSGLSGSYNNARMAKECIMDEYKDADITVIDSKCASMGEGLLAYYAYEMYNKGCSKEEIVTWVEENKLKINHWFTVDDLNHLKRGGRVSSVGAAIGTLLSIKPVLHVDDQGHLIPVTKVKGRKQSLRLLVDKLKERSVDIENQVIFISHGDCAEDAEFVKRLILESYNVKEIIINNIGPVIGSHSGPGTVALFFLGENR
jgi:DegV family protein with EDD domain